MATKAEKLLNEYAICKRRGHEEDYDADSVKIAEGVYAHPCVWCKTVFWHEQVLHEQNTPQPVIKKEVTDEPN